MQAEARAAGHTYIDVLADPLPEPGEGVHWAAGGRVGVELREGGRGVSSEALAELPCPREADWLACAASAAVPLQKAAMSSPSRAAKQRRGARAGWGSTTRWLGEGELDEGRGEAARLGPICSRRKRGPSGLGASDVDRDHGRSRTGRRVGGAGRAEGKEGRGRRRGGPDVARRRLTSRGRPSSILLACGRRHVRLATRSTTALPRWSRALSRTVRTAAGTTQAHVYGLRAI